MIRLDRLLRSHPTSVAPEGHHHHREGWIHFPCPFCTGNPGFHLGWNVREGYFRCWRCGFRKTLDAIAGIWRVPEGTAREWYRDFNDGRPTFRTAAPDRTAVRAREVPLPRGSGPLLDAHLAYLQRRGFPDPRGTEAEWGLKGMGHLGEWKWRIIAPVLWEGRVVSYMTRSIVDAVRMRYKPCPRDQEARDHHTLLYGADLVPHDTVIIVEGIVDAWKLGPGAVATFGIAFTTPQIDLLSRFSRRLILYDNDPKGEGQRAAEALANHLAVFSGETEVITLHDKDPGELPLETAREVARDLLRR